MGTIRNGDGWSYALTPTDKLWAARMAQFEGGEAADVLWTMTQAYAQPSRHNNPVYPTFTRFIQAYSQPINPIWRRDGSKCRLGGSHHGRDDCSAVRLDRRDIAASMPWSEIEPEIKRLTQLWYDGVLPNPVPRAVEFAAPAVSEGFIERNPGSQILKRLDNWYIGTRSSLAWPASWVTMTSGGPSGAGSVLAIGAAAAGAWWFWRRNRR